MVNSFGKKVILFIISIIICLTKSIIVVPRGTCRFYPSCTEYVKEAFKTMPFIIAFYKTVFRLLRCNPFSKGGYDPVILRER